MTVSFLDGQLYTSWDKGDADIKLRHFDLC